MTDREPTPAGVRAVLTDVILRGREFVAWPAARQDLALRLARRARLLGRLAAELCAAGLLDALPPVARDQLVSALTTAEARERLARWELDRIAWAAGDDELPLVALKGAAYLLLDLPNTAGRVFADVDLLTAESRLDELEARLNRRGWQTRRLSPYDDNYYRRWTHELPPLTHREREMEVDLHHNVLPRTARLKPDGERLVAAARPVPGSPYRVLANEDIVLHAMTHLMFADEIADKLRDLVDIHDLLRHFSGESGEFWPAFVRRAEVLDLRRPAWYSLRYVDRLLGPVTPDEFAARIDGWGPPAPVRRLMDRLVPAALFPFHPDRADRGGRVARLFLYLRSHWVRMPPWLLAYHLGYKFLATRVVRRPRH